MLSIDLFSGEDAEPGATPRAQPDGHHLDPVSVQEGLSRGFGPGGQLQAPLQAGCWQPLSHLLPACSRCWDATGCCFYLWRTPAAGGQRDETCLTHTPPHRPQPRSPSELPWESSPPNPSLIKKLKLPISSRINVDFRPRQSPDTSHNLRWLQAAGGACWRTRMTSHRLPRTGVTRRARSREGSAQPIHCHHAMPWTHQDGCWSKGWSRAPS